MKNFDKTIQMKIFNGNPNGIIMCELSNWNGRVYKISRSDLNNFSKREDSNNTGLYFLFGKDDQNFDTVYVGEAEQIVNRLKNHIPDKNYWNDCIAVISKDNILNKAHVKFLENKFYNIIKSCDKTNVINVTIPTCSSVSEYDEAMLYEFIENTKLLINTLGYNIFSSPEYEQVKNDNDSGSDKLFYIKTQRGADAIGMSASDGFWVLKGSKIANKPTSSVPSATIKYINKLQSSAVIVDNQFTKDHCFSSPSLAASIVMTRSANGLTEWKDKNGKTLKEIEQSNIE